MQSMNPDVQQIASWHAHVYFDAETRDTDNEMRDHRDCAIWIGHRHELLLSALDG